MVKSPFFNDQSLRNYALIGSKFILVDDLLKQQNCTFESNPSGCYRLIMIECMNDAFLMKVVGSHPSLRPAVEQFQAKFRDGSAYPDGYELLFNTGLELIAEETETDGRTDDVYLDIMVAAIGATCYDYNEVGALIDVLLPRISEQETFDEVQPLPLISCILWGTDHGGFRTIATAVYQELKAQGFGAKKENTDEVPQGDFEEAEKQKKLAEARANIDHFDEKIKFILDVNAQAEENIDSLDSQVELGKKYVRYYMEIEKYYIDPLDRLRFVAFCSDALPETLLKNGGFVPFDYYTNQIEKCIESLSASQRLQFIRTIAARANSLAGWEMLKAIAEGDFDLQSYGWQRMSRYIYNRSEEWGWDCIMEDGTQWGGVPSKEEPSQSQTQNETKQTTSSNQPYNANISDGRTAKSGGCYVATAVYGSYDCPEVWVLRRFRDHDLAKSWYGRIFIYIYYALSPILVCWFGKTKWFQHFWRVKLDSMVKKLQDQGYENSPYQDRIWR